MVGISLKMPETLAAEVSAAARYRGVGKSALIREAIETFLRREDAIRSRSALSLVADLAGACEGPGDLSGNTKHREGLGE